MTALIYSARPEYYRLSAAIVLVLTNWYVIRTVIDYATGFTMVLLFGADSESRTAHCQIFDRYGCDFCTDCLLCCYALAMV